MQVCVYDGWRERATLSIDRNFEHNKGARRQERTDTTRDAAENYKILSRRSPTAERQHKHINAICQAAAQSPKKRQ